MKKILVLVSILLMSVLLSACNTVNNNEADVSDQTFLTPPEEEGEVTGIWNAEKDELIIDRYFYGDGKLVTITATPEEEYFCTLSTWVQEDKKLIINPIEEYKYNDSDGVWEKEDITRKVLEAEIKDGLISTDETLPDGNTQSFEFKRGLAELSVPASTDLIGYINAFLGH